jgi:hypothetical protein
MDDWMKSITEGADAKWKVTGPFNVGHTIHVDFTSETGFVVRTKEKNVTRNPRAVNLRLFWISFEILKTPERLT